MDGLDGGMVLGIAWRILVGGLVVVGVQSYFGRRKTNLPPAEEPPSVQTPMGRFGKYDGEWYLMVSGSFDINVNDREGTPDLDFIARLPDLLKDLEHYERLAREAHDQDAATESANREYDLISFSQAEGDHDFVLGFNVAENGEEIGSVLATFSQGQVVDTALVH